MPKGFISYSHDSAPHRDAVLTLSNRLRREGVDCFIDRYVNGSPPEGWRNWMREQIESADYVLLVCTETYKRRYEGKDREGGRGVTFEGVVIGQTLYEEFQQNSRFIPLIPDEGSFDHVPIELKGGSIYRLGAEYESIYRILTGQPETKMPELGEIRTLDAESNQTNSTPARSHPLPTLQAHELKPSPIIIDKLPTVPGEFFGREAELELLDKALADDKTRIVEFIAAGGTGKTKLLRHWLDHNEERVPNRIVWSFYSQGTTEATQVSSSPLFDEGFKNFRVDQGQFNTEEAKADALAELLFQHHSLLVLDGLEPLQQVGRGLDGRLKDRALARLLNRLINRPGALCIITTRIPVHELRDRPQAISHDLGNLSTADGIRLLRSHQVRAREEPLRAVVKKVGGHALTLHLLGNAIKTHLYGDALRLDTLDSLVDAYDDTGRHAFKVMQAYEEWLRDDRGQPLPELQLLYLLGLFDHPIETGVLQVLWDQQIPGLTQGIDHRAWNVAIRDLRDTHHLLAQHPHRQDLLDCHPLIREYFGGRLQANHPEAWRRAHARLYVYYKALPKKEQPDSLDEMRPLFAAVAHGCAAGMHQQALDEVYWPRIQRGNEYYLARKFGAFSDDLATVAHLFTEPWHTPAANLTPNAQAIVLNWAGSWLHALGRLREALEPMRANIEMSVK
jgi:hypothetical protein